MRCGNYEILTRDGYICIYVYVCACVRACVCNFNLKILLIATQSFTLSKRSSGDTTLNSLLAQLIERFADAIASCTRAFKIPRAK